eukprot:4417955-Pyramimonas_sp.AAC.1
MMTGATPAGQPASSSNEGVGIPKGGKKRVAILCVLRHLALLPLSMIQNACARLTAASQPMRVRTLPN